MIQNILYLLSFEICLTNTASIQPGMVDGISEQDMSDRKQSLDNLKEQNQELLALVQRIKQENEHMKQLGCNKEFTIDVDRRLDSVLHVTGSNSTVPLENTFGMTNRQREYLRRRVENGVQQFWFYQRAQFEELVKTYSSDMKLLNVINQLKESATDYNVVLMGDLQHLSFADGDGVKRKAEITKLSNSIQHRLNYIQNPSSCFSAKKLSCQLVLKICGLGCMTHHIIDCMYVSYATKRAIVLDSGPWYQDREGWETLFLPLSRTCTIESEDNITGWGPPEEIEDAEVVLLPPLAVHDPRPDYMPLAIPDDIAPPLMRLHGHPIGWWFGQMLKYLFRPQPELRELIENAKRSLGFQKPIVGLHVRRSDKLPEAAYLELDDYMVYVAEYYRSMSLTHPAGVKRVYLATDTEEVVEEARTKYPDYHFITNSGQAQFLHAQDQRNNDDAIKSILIDLYFLSRSDFLICTFSSNVCRMAYEIMQTLHTDASNFWYSLDSGYFADRQGDHEQRVLDEYITDRNPSIEPGDVIRWEHEWGGAVSGHSEKKDRRVVYARYMVEDITSVANFTSYDDVDAARTK